MGTSPVKSLLATDLRKAKASCRATAHKPFPRAGLRGFVPIEGRQYQLSTELLAASFQTQPPTGDRHVTELDNHVVIRARAGDEDACRTIIEVLHRPLLATVHRFLGSRFRADVEDIAQDIFLKIFRSLDRFDPERGVKFTTWVYTFVRNHCFDVLKKRRLRTASLAAPVDGQPDTEVLDASDDRPPRRMENAELGRKIEEALAALGEDQRMVFVLREYEGLEYGAIAVVMGISEGTVKSRLHRAKEALRHRLEPYLRAGA
jgi:RNA polymerase sigma-70 factor (ECF subfamily)